MIKKIKKSSKKHPHLHLMKLIKIPNIIKEKKIYFLDKKNIEYDEITTEVRPFKLF